MTKGLASQGCPPPGGIIRVAEGWARDGEVDKGARCDATELGPVVNDLIAKPLPVFGA